jgi:branched-chain amino acid aminotransferase
MAFTKSERIWMNGEFVRWEDAKIHILAHVIHYGSAVFEGMRCYATPKGPGLFRLDDHVRRLFDSAKIYRMDVPYTREEIAKAIKDTVRENNYRACYVRPLIYRGYGAVGVNPLPSPVDVAIATWEWGSYLGPGAAENGVDVCVSSWTRIAPNTLPALAKSAANYMNSQLTKIEAISGGYVEGIMLSPDGHVCEGSGENLFAIRDGILYTPPLSASILAGITRDSAIQIARDMQIDVVETDIPREMLYIADELFFVGTAVELTPIRSVDKIKVGSGRRGPITEAIQRRFLDTINGKAPDTHGWLTYVPEMVAAGQKSR